MAPSWACPLSLLSYPSSIPLFTRALNHLAGLIRHHRA
jgi:hypothetical protein